MTIPKNPTLLVVFPIVVLLTTIVGGLALNVPRDYSLVTNARTTIGIVVSKDSKQHRTVYFDYQVNGQTFRSGGSAEDAGTSFEAMEIGQTVPVTYDATNYSSALIGLPNKHLNDGLRLLGFQFLMVTFTFVGLAIKNFATGRMWRE
jgi:hypothetical protein